MKRKLLSILLIGAFAIGLTGCGNNKKNELSEKNQIDNDLVGSWTLNRNTAVEPSVKDKMYGTLRNLFGDSLGSGDGALKLNSDGTFSIELGVAYQISGEYQLKDNKVTFKNIRDKEARNKDSIKELEENLYLDYIEYNNHKFMKMLLYGYDYEIYIFFEKEPEKIAGSYADDDIPQVIFNNNGNTGDTTTNTSNSNYEKTTDGLKINGYTIKYGTYSSKYTTTQTESQNNSYTSEVKIKINSNDTITMYGPMGDEADYPFTIENNTIKVGNNTIEIVDNNKVKYSTDDLLLEYKGE